MAQLVIAATADADTDGILADLATKAGRHTASRYLDRFEKLYDRLAEHPASGPRRPALGPHARIGIVASYVVVYEHSEADDIVTVLRIVHGRRKISGALLRQG